MSTPQEIRRARLVEDHRQMRRIHSNVVQVEAFGSPPEKYVLAVNVRTITGPQPRYRTSQRVEVVLPSEYPFAKPLIKMLDRPQPYHPNWWDDGTWCLGDDWDPEESLGYAVLRMIRTLQFDPDITNPKSAANSYAARWYQESLHKNLFPCDRSVLPDPDHNLFNLQQSQRGKFQIRKA